jgi:hypothetical protein
MTSASGFSTRRFAESDMAWRLRVRRRPARSGVQQSYLAIVPSRRAPRRYALREAARRISAGIAPKHAGGRIRTHRACVRMRPIRRSTRSRSPARRPASAHGSEPASRALWASLASYATAFPARGRSSLAGVAARLTGVFASNGLFRPSLSPISRTAGNTSSPSRRIQALESS